MEETVGQDFQAQVHAALNDQLEEEKIYTTLKAYSDSQDVEALVRSLRVLLADPNRLHLFEAIRPFVAVKHQMKYDRICPTVPGRKLKTIRLMRKGIEDLGFTFRGGLDYGTGVFVSRVDQKSLAEIHGLMPGDQIIRINGYDLSQALHSEVLLLLKIRNQTLELKVRRMGLMPVREEANDNLVWTFVEGNKSEADEQLKRASAIPQGSKGDSDRKVHVTLEAGAKLGCGIGSNEDWGQGIYVCRVTSGSVADTLGFNVGDQVIEVNGVSYIDISHEEAVMNLKTSRHLTVILRSREAQDGPIVAYSKPVEKSQPELASQKTTTADVSPIPKSPEPLYASVTKTSKSETDGNWSFQKKEDDWWTADPKTLFNPIQIDGRELKKVSVVKDGPLNMFLEGGNKTPLGGKIVVSDIYPDGAINRNGNIHKGDQIMMCEGEKLVDVPLEKAEEVFKKHMLEPLDGTEILRLIVASSPPKDYEDEITFF